VLVDIVSNPLGTSISTMALVTSNMPFGSIQLPKQKAQISLLGGNNGGVSSTIVFH